VAVWCNKTAGFEIVHGMLDRAMKMLDVPRISSEDFKAKTGYYIKESNDPAFFPGRAATIYYRTLQPKTSTLSAIKQDVEAALHVRKDIEIGTLGILHPTVLEKFEIGFPCSALEFTLEPFKKQMQKNLDQRVKERRVEMKQYNVSMISNAYLWPQVIGDGTHGVKQAKGLDKIALAYDMLYLNNYSALLGCSSSPPPVIKNIKTRATPYIQYFCRKVFSGTTFKISPSGVRGGGV